MYYEPQSGQYFSYDAVTKTHQYHGHADPVRFAQLWHIIYSRSQCSAAGTQAHKQNKVYFTYLIYLGPVAPISVNFNHQLAYFADQSDTTHVPHQPTAVA